ncbi:MAG: hypothetical protein LLF98_02660 [Clostridium sp.]|uniref:hypothetical protein n=1 Tax=Clostridium sp. TaxID=1506 RepID=UPI0025B967AF|nr:hypothetical protein [Clostridium sp.]MCE5220185.1 hypothetical protein [Clostridium sp.]
MEKFFIVTEDSKLHNEYIKYKNNIEQIRLLVKEFLEENNIETTLYGYSGDELAIIPTENDINNFGKFLGKEFQDGLRYFKKNTKIAKIWANKLESNNIKVLHKPYVQFYFRTSFSGKSYTRLFDIDNVVYCSYRHVGEGEIDNPEGMTEIKASKFWEIIENEEERRKENNTCN